MGDFTYARASKVPIGPTTGETPGKLKRKPSAARSICAALCVAAALTFGSRALNSFHFCPRAARTLSLPSSRPKLFRSARSMASLNESANTSPVAFPSGTLLVNGLCPPGADGNEFGVGGVEYDELRSDELAEVMALWF